MKNLRILLGIALLCGLSGIASGQNVRVDEPFPSVSATSPPFLVANLPPNSPTLSVCHSPANNGAGVACTNYAQTFDSLGNACPNGAQDTPQPQPSACQSTADNLGNIGFWIPPGVYTYTVCIQNNCFGPYTITPGGSGGSGGNPLQVNGSVITSGDTVNFNNTTPAAPANGLNILFGTSKSGSTDSVSAWIQGDGTSTDCLIGTGVFSACPGSGGGVPTAIASAPLVSQGPSVTPVYIQGIQYATTAQAWSQSSTTALTAGTPALVVLTPCPLGVDITSGDGYQVYINDANPEAVNVTGGSTGSGNCTLTLAATFFSHSSYTIGTASSGIQETLNNACGVDPTYFHNAQCNVTIPANGPGYPTHSISTYNVQGTIFFHSNQSVLSGYGVSLNCLGRGPCIQVGDLTTSNHFTNMTVSGLSMRSPVNLSSVPAFAGVPITQTQKASQVVTITTASAHGFRVGDLVTILFTDNNGYWGDAVITSVPSTTTFTYAHSGIDVALQSTPGVVALAYVPFLDNGFGTHFIDISYDKVGNGGGFNNFFDMWDDENATIDHFNNNAIQMNNGANWMASYVFSAGNQGSLSQIAPVITLENSNITANFSSCVTDYNSNGLYIKQTVCQAQGPWQVYASNSTGNFQGAHLADIYSEANLSQNPASPPHSPFAGLGVAGLIAGASTGVAQYQIEGPAPIGIFPTGGTGATAYSYFIVVNDTTAGTQTSPMQILNWVSTGSDSIPVKWPRVANGADTITYDVIRTATPVGVTNPLLAYPYNGGCPGGAGGICGSVTTGISQATACSGTLTCTFTDSGSSSTTAYTVKQGNYAGNLNFWPGSLVSVNNTVRVDVEASPVVGIGLSFNPLQVATRCIGFGVSSPGGYTDCFSSVTTSNNSIKNQTGTLLSDYGATGGGITASKGRLNFTGSPAISFGAHHIITLIDSQPSLTQATPGYRPPASVNDVWIGSDNGSGSSLTVGKLAFGSPISISQYIANTGSSSTGWLEQLTASLKEFAVAAQFDSTVKINPLVGSDGCLNVVSGVIGSTGSACSAGSVTSVFGRTGAVVATTGDYTPGQVGLGNVTNDTQTKAVIVPNTLPAAAQILVGNSGGTAYAPVSVSGDSTMTSAGVMTNQKINGIAVSGTPSVGFVPTGTSGTTATWQAPTTGFINPMTVLGDGIQATTGGTAVRYPGPTSPNGIAQINTSTPSGGVATSQQWLLPGVLGRAVSGTTATDTILTTDCAPTRVGYTGSVAVAVALPTATTLAVPNCVFRVANKESAVNDVTITPATWTINGASTLALHLGQVATIYVDPAGSNWIADVSETGLIAGTNVTFTRTALGLTLAAAGGGGGGGALSAITAATAGNTIANGNFPQVWNFAQTTNSQSAFTFGETSAATGTSDNELTLTTLGGSLATPLNIVQAGITGTPNVPAINITSTINNAGNNTPLINVTLTNTSSSAPALLNFNGGLAGTTQELFADALGDIQLAGTLSTTASAGFLEACGGNNVACVTSLSGQLGSAAWVGESNGSSNALAKAGAGILSGGFLTNASPTGLEGVVQVQAAYIKLGAGAIANVGDVVCGTTTQFQVTDCPVGAINVIGIADTVATPVGVISDGEALVKFDGTATLGDMACSPPATGTAGLAHDNGTSACPPGSALGTIVANSGTITIIEARATANVAMSSTLALVQLHIAPVGGLLIPTGTATFSTGTGVTSVVCASGFSCNNTRGTLTIVGGTGTTGTIATVTFSASLGTAPACFASMNGGATAFGIGNSAPTATAFNVTAAVSIIGATFNVNYECRP